MGKSYESVRQGVNSIANRWVRSTRALKKEDQQYGERFVKLAKMHSSGSYFGCDDPLEAVIFSVLTEMIKHQENQGGSKGISSTEYHKDASLSLKYWT